MRSIGETARASGLSVSALRFYDGAGVLVPAMVDPATGYRWYADHQIRSARLVAGLRRVGMPLADIARALGHLDEPDAVRRLLAAHLRRLEDGLTDARRELSRIHALLDSEEIAMNATTRLTVSGRDLAAAVDAVRFAVGHDPGLPGLGGVLIELEPAALRLVATDRYRLAVSETSAVEVDGPPVRTVAPVAFLDETRAALTGDGTVTLAAGAGTLGVEAAGLQISGRPLDVEFPDYRRLVADPDRDPVARRVPVDVRTLRRALAPGTAPTAVREHEGVRFDVVALTVDAAGELALAAEDAWQADPGSHVAVNREFLLQALDAGGSGQLVLNLDGPIKPLAVRNPADNRTFSILMPVAG